MLFQLLVLLLAIFVGFMLGVFYTLGTIAIEREGEDDKRNED